MMEVLRALGNQVDGGRDTSRDALFIRYRFILTEDENSVRNQFNFEYDKVSDIQPNRNDTFDIGIPTSDNYLSSSYISGN
jgi:hypothetical protein